MNKRTIPTAFLQAMCFLLLPLSQALGNDSVGVLLPAGGLILRKTDQIVMEKESLRLSRKSVDVDYLFHNTSPKDIRTIVTFPTPDYSPDTEDEGAPDIETFKKSFKVWIDSVSVTSSVKDQAWLNGRQITELLIKNKIPIADGDDARKRLRQLNAAEHHELVKQKVFDQDEVPLWKTRTIFYWEQIFPAGKMVRVQHHYSPMTTQGFPFEEYLGDYCSSKEKVQAMNKASGGYYLHYPTRMGYILKTGNNWAGPIRSFDLTILVEPNERLFTCFKPLAQTSDGNFSIHLDNFTPTQDINLMFPLLDKDKAN